MDLDKQLLVAYTEERSEIISKKDIEGYMVLEKLEEKLLSLEQVDEEPVHTICEGTYTREMFMPAGVMVTGKRHKKPCVNILAKGAISVASVDEDGVASEFELLRAPYTFVSTPGKKKIGYVHEDCHFINSFSVQSNNVKDIEKEIYFKDDIFNKQECLTCQDG